MLTVALVRLVAGEPTRSSTTGVRWLTADELHDVDWLEPDRPFLAASARRPRLGR